MTTSTNKLQQKQQQQLAKEVSSPQITKIRIERIIPLHKDETLSADLIDQPSFTKFNNNYKFILTVRYFHTPRINLVYL